MNEKTITLAIIVPCYNEDKIINQSVTTLIEKLKSLEDKQLISTNSYIYFVNDGSKDNTWNTLKELANKNDKIKALNLANNVGHQNAIWAGMMQNKNYSDGIVTIDCDLQDDLDVVDKFLEAHYQGNDICYGVKRERQCDSTFKKLTAYIFYKLMNFLGVKLIYNHADFRFISKKAVISLSSYSEYSLFLRGIFPLMGFRSKKIEYNINDRIGGESKYTLSKMIKLAINGVTSFSDRPLYYVFLTGLIVASFAMFMIIYVIIIYLQGNAIPGWASTTIPTYLLGGIQLISLGIIGIYVGKTFIETKNRPKFIIDEEIN